MSVTKSGVGLKYFILAMSTFVYIAFCTMFFHIRNDNFREVMKDYLYDARQDILSETYADDNLSLVLSYLIQQQREDMMSSTCFFSLKYNPRLKVWGENMEDEGLKGTLQSKKSKISCNQLAILHFFDKLYQSQRETSGDNKQLNYFISKDSSYIYFPKPLANRSFAESDMFNKMTNFSKRDFVSFMKNKKLSWTYNARTDIYDDLNTGQKVISVASVVYDFTDLKGEDIIGYIVRDYIQDELKRIIYDRIPPQWRSQVEMTVRDRYNNSVIKYGTHNRFSTSVKLNFSRKYEVIYSYPFSIILTNNKTTLLISLGTYFMAMLMLMYIYNMMITFRNDSVEDPLTGCYNRRYLENYAASRPNKNESTGVLVLDCNNFKLINDQLGHDSGDRALILLVNTLNQTFRRKTDKLIRLGGDEFCVIISDPKDIDIHKIIDRVNQKLQLFNPEIIFSVSWGYHTVEGGDIIGALQRADEQQYKNKEFTRK